MKPAASNAAAGSLPISNIGAYGDMGLSMGPAHFLIECRRKIGPFGKTVMLGRQAYKTTRLGRVYAMLSKFGYIDGNAVSQGDLGKQLEAGGSERFLEILGASPIHSMDISDYQGATVLHDLNTPLRPELFNSYDTVIDGGTIEHVFNVPEAFRTVMRMVRPGGHFLALSIANNYYNHGLYQFSAELFYRTFSPENGFEIRVAKLYTGGELRDEIDPGPTHRNNQMAANADTALILIAAQKVADKEPFAERWPAQGQYGKHWQDSTTAK